VSRYLVDTDVISADAPTKAVTRPGLIDWMDAHSADLFLSAVTIAEIAEGIAKARRKGAERKAADLSDCIACSPSTPRRLRSPALYPILRADEAMLQALPTSPSLQRRGAMNWQFSPAMSAILR
jgi:hypothetical protein